MATLVCFHAHPDDEAIATGGVMAQAASAGHRVVLVTATRGEQGEPKPGVLGEGEPLWRRREAETHEAGRILGAEVVFLGYLDSGMMGAPANDDPACFWRANLFEAAGRLATILRDVRADVLTVYDDHGTYGHPDHIQVHRVGTLAATLAGLATTAVFYATHNRDLIRRLQEQHPELGAEAEVEGGADLDVEAFGEPEAAITHAIDVRASIDRKRAAMAAHRSQIGPDDFFLAMPAEQFAAAFGTEWFVQQGVSRPPSACFRTDLLEGLR